MYQYYVRCYCGHLLFSDGHLFTSFDDFHRKGYSCPICKQNLTQYLPDDLVEPDQYFDKDNHEEKDNG